MQEFHDQYTAEEQFDEYFDKPSSFMKWNSIPKYRKDQAWFLGNMVRPMFTAMQKLIPNILPIIENIDRNIKVYGEDETSDQD